MCPAKKPFRLTRIKPLIWGGIITFFVIVIALAGPALSNSDPFTQDLSASLKPPGSAWLFGTDSLGRDIFSRVLYGCRISLGLALTVLLLSMTVGLVFGTAAGYFGGLLDSLIMRFADVLLTFPALVLAMIAMAFAGSGIFNLIVVFVIIYSPSFVRLTRAQVLTIKTLPFIDAAKISGTSGLRLLTKHVLANCIAPIVAYGMMLTGEIIISETALSFLGLGIQAPEPSLGVMLADAKNYVFSAPWLIVFPGLTVLLIVLGFNLLGDGISYVLNPKLPDRIGVRNGNFKGSRSKDTFSY